jgi:NSS family neurotransmitter:Na+ symporter
VFSLFEFLSAECLMLIGGLLVVLFAGWKLGRKGVFEELTNGGDIRLSPRMFEILLFLIRFVAPVALLAIAVFQIHE